MSRSTPESAPRRGASGARRTVLTGARLVLPQGVVDNGRVVVDGPLITAVTEGAADPAGSPSTPDGPNGSGGWGGWGGSGRTEGSEGSEGSGGGGAPRPAAPASASAADPPPGTADRTIDLTGHWLVPGFVDMHVHGGGGASFTAGTTDEALTVLRTHRRHGTTTMAASTVTGDLGDLARQAGVLSELTEQGDLAGIHFEGPFIARNRCGAHEPALLRDPDPAAVRKLVDAARGSARMVTLAPELPGGLDSVRLLADSGVIAAIGHTDAGYETARQAVDLGATVATHLFNAMPPLAHRAPGPVAALLEDDRVTVELINDGVHLHPSVLQLAFRRAGAERVTFITDAMAATGMGDGSYLLGPMEVEVREGVARLARGGSIAGSTLTLDRAFHRAVTVDRLPVPDVVRALSSTPARMLGLADRVGSVAPGKDADLVVLDADFLLAGVLRKGEWVVGPPVA